jgi:hypothetical protein
MKHDLSALLTTQGGLPRLTVSQQTTANLLGVSVDMVEGLAKRGVLERVRLGPRKYGVKVPSILKLIGGAE